jgi:hypothetical protein
MKETNLVSEMTVDFDHLIQQTASEDFTESCHLESFKVYT